MQKTKSFHPEEIIFEHFDILKNKIDLKTETLFEENNLKSDTVERELLNDLRDEQLKKITEIQKRNLSLVKSDDSNSFLMKWSHVIDDPKLTFDEKIEILKHDLIAFDCLLLSDSEFKSGISLFVVPIFFNKKYLEIFK